MHAVVLVGGFGTRLRPLTDTTPKSMLTVGNETIVARLVRRLEAGGVTSVTLALGFLPDPFIAAFPDGRLGGVEMRYAVEPEPLDTGGAIRFAALDAGIDSTFVVVNGDVVSDLDVGAMVAAHRARDAEATLHLIPVEDPSAYGVVELGADERIVAFVEKPAPGTAPSNLISAGTYVLEPEVVDLIAADVAVSVERITFPTLVERGRIHGHATDDYWIDVGRPELLIAANLDRLAGRFDADFDHPVRDGHGIDVAADVDGSAAIEASVVAAGVTVGPGATVARSVLLAGAHVGADATVADSIVMGDIGAGATVERVTVGATGIVAAGTVVRDARVPAPA